MLPVYRYAYRYVLEYTGTRVWPYQQHTIAGIVCCWQYRYCNTYLPRYANHCFSILYPGSTRVRTRVLPSINIAIAIAQSYRYCNIAICTGMYGSSSSYRYTCTTRVGTRISSMLYVFDTGLAIHVYTRVPVCCVVCCSVAL